MSVSAGVPGGCDHGRHGRVRMSFMTCGFAISGSPRTPEAAGALIRNPPHIYEVEILGSNFTLLISDVYIPEPVAKCPPLLGSGRASLPSTRRSHPDPVLRRRCRMLAILSYDDPAAELHEDASAGLREHPALPGLLDLAPVLARRSAWTATSIPPAATMRAPWPITESDQFLGPCAADRPPCRLGAAATMTGCRIRRVQIGPLWSDRLACVEVLTLMARLGWMPHRGSSEVAGGYQVSALRMAAASPRPLEPSLSMSGL